MEQRQFQAIEILSYLVLVVGTVGDHLSTTIALQSPGIYETNQFAVFLMSRGLWLPFDIILILLGISIPYLIIRTKKGMPFRSVLVYPLVLGIVRLCACFWNFSIA